MSEILTVKVHRDDWRALLEGGCRAGAPMTAYAIAISVLGHDNMLRIRGALERGEEPDVLAVWRDAAGR